MGVAAAGSIRQRIRIYGLIERLVLPVYVTAIFWWFSTKITGAWTCRSFTIHVLWRVINRPPLWLEFWGSLTNVVHVLLILAPLALKLFHLIKWSLPLKSAKEMKVFLKNSLHFMFSNWSVQAARRVLTNLIGFENLIGFRFENLI